MCVLASSFRCPHGGGFDGGLIGMPSGRCVGDWVCGVAARTEHGSSSVEFGMGVDQRQTLVSDWKPSSRPQGVV